MTSSILNRSAVLLLTNRSGAAVAQGDVVVLDATASSSFTTTAVAAYADSPIGVVLDTAGIADDATGTVVWSGYAPKVHLSASASLGQTFNTSASAGIATAHSSLATGDFGQVLSTGATPEAYLWGMPKQAAPVVATPVISVIETVTLASPGVITFSSIPQTYKHLLVKGSGRSTSAGTRDILNMRLGTGGGAVDTGANYSSLQASVLNTSWLTPTPSITDTYANLSHIESEGSVANSFSPIEVEITAYTNAVYKALVARANLLLGGGLTDMFWPNMSAVWRNTGSVTSVWIAPSWGTFVTGSWLTLYGIN